MWKPEVPELLKDEGPIENWRLKIFYFLMLALFIDYVPLFFFPNDMDDPSFKDFSTNLGDALTILLLYLGLQYYVRQRLARDNAQIIKAGITSEGEARHKRDIHAWEGLVTVLAVALAVESNRAQGGHYSGWDGLSGVIVFALSVIYQNDRNYRWEWRFELLIYGMGLLGVWIMVNAWVHLLPEWLTGLALEPKSAYACSVLWWCAEWVYTLAYTCFLWTFLQFATLLPLMMALSSIEEAPSKKDD